jgi:hypothetical protein
MILRRDCLSGLGIKFDFADSTIEWVNVAVPMKDADKPFEESYHIQEPKAIIKSTDNLKTILEAKYEKANLEEMTSKADYPTMAQRKQLLEVLKEREHYLFDGTLGKWKMGAYQIELRPDAKPYHVRAYPIPKAYTETLKVEVNRLVEA